MSCFEEQLISHVREKDFLYNPQSRKYKNIVKRDEAWATIAANLDTPVEKCKQRWKSLRDRYVRERKIMNDARGATTDSDVEPWEFFASLEFLNDSLRKKRASDNPEEIPPQFLDENIEVKEEIFFEELMMNESVPAPSIECPAKKPRSKEFPTGEFFGNLSKLIAERFNTQQEPDENDLFMKVMAKKMKVLPEITKMRLQEQIFQMVNGEVMSFLEMS